VARGAEGRWSFPRVVQSSPEVRRCGRTYRCPDVAIVNIAHGLAPRENKALNKEAMS
jgi:hypothetical protein